MPRKRSDEVGKPTRRDTGSIPLTSRIEKPRTKKPLASRIKKPRTKKPEKICEPHCDCESVQKSVNAELLAVTHPPLAGQQQSTTDKIVFVTQPADLKKIKSDTVQLAVWRRATAPEFVTALSDPSIAASGLPSFSGKVTPESVAQAMKMQLKSQKKRALTDSCIDELVHEVDELVHIFAKISKSKTVFVKLEVLDDNGCEFWHQDCVSFRLVTTYRGPCTQWVHPDFSQATLRRRQFDSKHAQSLLHHDVALFKGRGKTLKGGALLNHPGIVHRSPRIEGSGIYRVVLVLDIPAPWHLK